MIHQINRSIQRNQRLVNDVHLNRKMSFDLSCILTRKNRFVFQKGFGAQKVSTDFNEIERNVQEQEKLREQQVFQELKTREENEKQLEKQM